MTLSPRTRRLTPLALLFLPVLGSLVPPEPGVQDPQDRGLRAPQEPTAPFPRSGEYFGMDGCIVCHEREQKLILAGSHRQVVQAAELSQCETCHGPGAAHGEDLDNNPALITHPPTLGATEQFAFCGRCHGEQLDGHGGDPQGFVQAGKGCTDCHAVHEEVPQPAFPKLRFRNRTDTRALAELVGAETCVQCHPLRNELLEKSHHQSLAVASSVGCEGCHGAGSLHVETQGLARLITRPDRAQDGVATCLSCHTQVDPVEFHWLGKHQPLLTVDATCTTCHRVHEARPEVPLIVEPLFAALGLDPKTPWPLTDARILGPIQDPAARTPVAQPTNGACFRCHQPAFGVLPGTVHEKLGRLTTPLDQGCGSCHQGSENHALGSGRKDLVQSMRGTSAAVQKATCGKCHGDEEALRHVNVGAHNRSEVSCLSCHSPAAPAGRVLQDAESKCQTCHQNVAAQFRQPNRHPVAEGRMWCSDCHEPHGARRRFRDLELRQGRCVTCHREYRGPYVFAHQASRVDGCVICHSPHGSSNNRMLLQATSQQNCMQCHGDFPAFHDQTLGSVFTSCLSCHTEIHGSNHNRFLFR